MTKLSNEQIQQILEGVMIPHHKTYDTRLRAYSGHVNCHNLDDLEEILSLRQEVAAKVAEVESLWETHIKVADELGIDIQKARNTEGKPSAVYLSYIQEIKQENKELTSHVERLQNHVESSFKLLDAAICPCCDKSGAYYDNHGEVCQCQWCDEVSKLKE